MEHRSTSSAWVRGVASTFASQGLDVASLFTDAGLSLSLLDQADQRWPTEQVSLLWQLAAERTGNPAVALANPHLARPDHYGIVGYAMMSSPDLLTGLCRLIRYLRIVSDAAVISLVTEPGGRWVRLDLFGGCRSIPRQRYEYGLLTLLTFCRWMLGDSLRPQSASFSFPKPADISRYVEAFGCPLFFDAKSNGFFVTEKDLSSELPTAIPQLADLHDRIAGLALSKLDSPQTTHRAQEAIMRRLQDGSPRRSQIASDLGLSDHTFQRRLSDEATSFTGLVDETRRELAHRHLSDSQSSLSEIAYLLGYSDQSTFFRACIRWFGRSPGEHRVRLALDPTDKASRIGA